MEHHMDRKKQVILAFPVNSEPNRLLRLDKEMTAISESTHGSKYEFHAVNFKNAQDFGEKVIQYGPSIVHVCGHGDEKGFTSESGINVVPKDLNEYINYWSTKKGTSLRAIFLNFCDSINFGFKLANRFDYVIAQSCEFEDSFAIEFVKKFYFELKMSNNFEECFELTKIHFAPTKKFGPVLIKNGKIIDNFPRNRFLEGSHRVQTLWQFAYAFLRLDQLPSGGWGKTLSSWMKKIGRDEIKDTGHMRKLGGTDITAYGFSIFTNFLRKALSEDDCSSFLRTNNVIVQICDTFKEKTTTDGAVGADHQPRAAKKNPKVRIRHSLMGALAFIHYQKMLGASETINELSNICNYLRNNLDKWQEDQSHLFAMTGAALKLRHSLSLPVSNLNDPDRIALSAKLDIVIPEMMKGANVRLYYEPRPPLPDLKADNHLSGNMFRPYNDFWRMERSSFLMHAHQFLTDDGNAFIQEVSVEIKNRFKTIILELFNDVATPYNKQQPQKSLIKYHRLLQGTGRQPPRDWGLSAEFAALLSTEAVRLLLLSTEDLTRNDYDEILEAIKCALIATFDSYDYDMNHGCFTYTQGCSFARILQLIDSVDYSCLLNIDKEITDLYAQGVTKRGISDLLNTIASFGPGSNDQKEEINAQAMRDLLLVKLESGEYTSDLLHEKFFSMTKTPMEEFYNKYAEQHILRYLKTPVTQLVTDSIEFVNIISTSKNKIGLDIGCGPGQYAKLLVEKGYEMHLLDISSTMLDTARSLIDNPKVSFHQVDLTLDNWGLSQKNYDLIFASAVLIHFPRIERFKIYTKLQCLLKPNGFLFVNFKYDDHTLIGEENRYFTYFSNPDSAEEELEEYFKIISRTTSVNITDMFQEKKIIKWVNFYCRKLLDE
jgi:SAM-dependent methyltransferase